MPRVLRVTSNARGLAFLAAALLTLAPLLSACSGDTEVAPPTASSIDDRSAAAQAVVSDLERAIEDGDARAAAELAVPDARPLLRAVVENADALALQLRSLRYLDDGVTLTPEEKTALPPGTWGGNVALSWRLPVWDARASSVETAILFDTHEGEERIVGFAPGTDRVPVWLAGPLEVQRSGRVLVLAGADDPRLGASRVLRLGRQAVAETTETLGWRGRLVLEVPATERHLENALVAGRDQYASIAAVTSSIDGSAGPRAPLHVLLNPAVFSRLGDQGAQVVMTHESVHVATRANASSAPNWMREGFADYVALVHADVPLEKAAAQAFEGVREDGPPKELPSDADLNPTAPGLGAAYEEAWLVCRFIAEEYGEDRLIAFYEAVDGGQKLPAALRDVLGTTEGELTSAWSRDLARLARAAGG